LLSIFSYRMVGVIPESSQPKNWSNWHRIRDFAERVGSIPICQVRCNRVAHEIDITMFHYRMFP